MKKVHNAEGKDRAFNELYNRYNNREATYDKSPEYAEQRSREIDASLNSTRTDADALKNRGRGKGYMTDKDFASYYKATREYTPKSNVELDKTILLNKVEDGSKSKGGALKLTPESRRDFIRKRLTAEAAKNNPSLLNRDQKSASSNPRRNTSQENKSEKLKRAAKEAAKTWVPLEERHKENIVEGGKTKLPLGIIFAIIVITISLFIIIGSAVLLHSARNEQNELKDAIESVEFQIAEAKTELNKKNEKLDIENYAKEVLGMIKQEHVSAGYIQSNKTDGVVKHNNKGASLASLIDWIVQALK